MEFFFTCDLNFRPLDLFLFQRLTFISGAIGNGVQDIKVVALKREVKSRFSEMLVLLLEPCSWGWQELPGGSKATFGAFEQAKTSKNKEI